MRKPQTLDELLARPETPEEEALRETMYPDRPTPLLQIPAVKFLFKAAFFLIVLSASVKYLFFD